MCAFTRVTILGTLCCISYLMSRLPTWEWQRPRCRTSTRSSCSGTSLGQTSAWSRTPARACCSRRCQCRRSSARCCTWRCCERKVCDGKSGRVLLTTWFQHSFISLQCFRKDSLILNLNLKCAFSLSKITLSITINQAISWQRNCWSRNYSSYLITEKICCLSILQDT